jgi:hypothetical protein
MAQVTDTYPVRFEIEYVAEHDRLTSFFRLFWCIPILVVLCVLSSGEGMGLAGAIALMIIFRQRYPRWWFDFSLEYNRFSTRVLSYLFLLTDRYPSTVDKQSVRLDIEYPDAQNDLNRWLPIVKWLLAIPHYIVLILLFVGVVFATIFAWLAILFTGRYPKGIFDYVVGVMRWGTRVNAYAFMLATDKYPPFSLS